MAKITSRGGSEPAIQNNVGLKKRRTIQTEEKVHLHTRGIQEGHEEGHIVDCKDPKC
jgi:hypothetical protein